MYVVLLFFTSPPTTFSTSISRNAGRDSIYLFWGTDWTRERFDRTIESSEEMYRHKITSVCASTTISKCDLRLKAKQTDSQFLKTQLFFRKKRIGTVIAKELTVKGSEFLILISRSYCLYFGPFTYILPHDSLSDDPFDEVKAEPSHPMVHVALSGFGFFYAPMVFGRSTSARNSARAILTLVDLTNRLG